MLEVTNSVQSLASELITCVTEVNSLGWRDISIASLRQKRGKSLEHLLLVQRIPN